MRYIFTIIFMFIITTFVIGQSAIQFEIEGVFVNDSSNFKRSTDFDKLDTAFFQDENYYVRRTCRGEWGGSIWFKNKKTGIEYSCAATCPVIVNKIENKYIVTTSLTHFSSFSSVFKIENPDSMDIFQTPEPKRAVNRLGWKKRQWYKWGYRKVYYAYHGGDFQSKSIKGRASLVDTAGVNILLSFPFEEQLYHIVSDSKLLYISKLENNILTTIDTICSDLDSFYIVRDGIRYGYITTGFETKDNHYVVLFENSGLVGFLDIYGNKIKFTRYK